jgi:trans-aconitate methyltransferase
MQSITCGSGGASMELNARNLARILDALSPAKPAWLDLGCGQAWHFSQFGSRAQMLGLDISPAQLAKAARNAPQASFVCADMASACLPPHAFDLATNFWGGYCYLDSHERIEAWLRRVVHWLRPGGALYIEVLLGRDLATFNASRFAQRNDFVVSARCEDYSQWHYDDVAGRHQMTSPPLELFLDVLEPAFQRIEALHDGGFMVHLIASARNGRAGWAANRTHTEIALPEGKFQACLPLRH